MLTKLFTALAVTAGVTSAAANTPVGKFNGYWGQNGHDRLKDRCDESPDYVSLSFVNVSPENGNGTGYPGTNFAAHCGAQWYHKDGRKSRLLKNCDLITEDINYCQSKGIKVLLSIGGVFNDTDAEHYSDYTVSTRENGVDFAKFLSNAFGTAKADYDGPRPFGDLTIDGFDFDIETPLDNGPWIAMIQALRTLNPSYFISGAPQCAQGEGYFYMREMIQQAQFDALFIQFYNNPGCDLIAGNTKYEEKFNYDEWEKTLAASENSKDAKIYIGLPADQEDGAHVRHEPLKHVVCQYSKRPSFGGISIWDLYLGSENKVDGKTYNEWVREILDNGCDENSSTTTKATTMMPTTTAVPTTTKATTSQATSKPWSNSTTTGEEMTTSTVYTTRTYTVTSCAPTVTDCPAGHVTTEVVPLYTTVCPVTEVQTPPAQHEPTTTVQKTVVVVPTDTGMQTSVRPTVSKPADNNDNNCPGGPNCPATTQPAGDNDNDNDNDNNNGNNGNNGNNCPGGPNCPPGVAIPTGGNHGNNTNPGNPPPVTAGASSMAVAVTGLVAAVAAQALLL